MGSAARRRLLLVSYYFPPLASVGSVRAAGLATYLPAHGWDVTVLTPRRDQRPPAGLSVELTDDADMATSLKRRLGLPADAALKDLVSTRAAPDTILARLRALLIDMVKATVAFPDTNRGWIPVATEAGSELLERERFDVMVSTSPPPSAHVVGNQLHKRHGLRWIADLRDLWADDRYSTAPRWRRRMDLRLERRTLRPAAALVTVSPPWAEELRGLHHGHDVHTIVNGFDPSTVNPGLPVGTDLEITHTGTLNQGRRDPSLLFTVVRDMIARGVLDRHRVRIRLYVRHEPWLSGLVARHQLEDVVELVAWTSREEVLEAQRRAQVLLLLHWGGVWESSIIQAKVFEYLAARRPILMLGGTRGPLTGILEETGAGVHLATADQLRDQLRTWWREIGDHGAVAWRGDPAKVARYSQTRVAEEYAALLEEVLARPDGE